MKKKKKKSKTSKTLSTSFRYRSEKGTFLSKKQAEKKAKSLGIDHLQLQQFFDVKRKEAKNSLVSVNFVKFWEKAREIGEELSRPQDITISHAEFIKDYLTKHKGQAFMNGERISKPNLAMFLTSYFSEFDYPIYLLMIEVYIQGNKMTLNLNEELHELVLEMEASSNGLGGVVVTDRFGNQAFLKSNL